MEIRTIEAFLPYYRNIRKRSRRVIDCIPRDQFEWTYREGKFTFADIVRHVAAAERHMFAENVQGNPSRYPGHTRELADGFDEVCDYMDGLHDESMAIFQRLSDEHLMRKCETPGGVAMTVWKWLRAMIEHEVHHRGQIYLMLGIIGVETPPLYGLTSEQVKDRAL